MPGDVRLRDVIEDDLPILFEHQLEPEAVRMAAFPPRDRDAFMAHWAKVLADGTGIKKAILCDGHVAGYIVCFEQAGERLVGYWIGKAYWGRGIATRALSAFLRQVETRPLFARVAKQNTASLRVLEKCGFMLVREENASSDTSSETVEEFILALGANASGVTP